MRRKTSQNLIPLYKKTDDESTYDIYPTYGLNRGVVKTGYAALAREISKESIVIIDGYIGVDWIEVRDALQSSFQEIGLNSSFI
ncbi:MAG: hypothetical protein HKN53_09505, partial [Maribacter sp.]|nr:hypothetical protein [Maribacter sp.]